MVSNTEVTVTVRSVPWWLVLIEGIVSLLFGIALITDTAMTTVFLVTVLGFYWLIRGIFSLIQIFVGGGVHWGWLLFSGILGIIAGLLVLRHPLLATLVVLNVVVIILGIEGLVMGAIGLYQAFSGAGWGTGILGALSILVGLILLLNLYTASAVLPYVIAGFLLVGGIVAIVYSFRLR